MCSVVKIIQKIKKKIHIKKSVQKYNYKSLIIKLYTEEFKKIQCLLDIRKIRKNKNKKRTSSCSYGNFSSRALFEFEKCICLRSNIPYLYLLL